MNYTTMTSYNPKNNNITVTIRLYNCGKVEVLWFMGQREFKDQREAFYFARSLVK